MIFVDSNIPMYLIGADHPNKEVARRLVERSVAEGDRLVTDVEVIQEILHRYVAINRRDAIQPAIDLLLGIVDEVFPIGLTDVERATRLVLSTERLSARDALHLALMQSRDVGQVMSFDHAFDGIPGLTRVTA
jgi:Predicted nucleic acid-binding protein, contains PIN domain